MANDNGEYKSGRSWWQRLMDGIYGRSLQSSLPTHTEPVTSIKQNDGVELDVTGDYAGIFNILNDPELSPENIDLNVNTIWKLGDQISKFGLEDGKTGQANTNIKVISKTLTNSLSEQIIRKYKAILLSVEAELDSIKQKTAFFKRLQEQKESYILELETEKEHNQNLFRRFLGWLYLTISFLLLVADIPLALSLTREAFDLKGWETWILCFGIAFCTIVFKIFYDEFIGSPLESMINQYKRASRKVKQNHGRSKSYADDKDELADFDKIEKKIKRTQVIRVFVKLFILLATISTIVLLANLRFLTVDPEKFPTLENAKGLTVITFVAITIIFPLVSGVCMSLGLHILGNVLDYKRAKRDHERISADLRASAKQQKELVEKETFCKRNIETCEGKSFEKDYTDYFVSRYYHGFHRGYVGPVYEKTYDDENDLFSKASALHFKAIAQNVMDNILSNNNKNENGIEHEDA